MGSPVGTNPFCFSLPLHLLLRLFRPALVCCSLFFLLVSVSGIFSLPSSFCLDSFRPLYWWVSFPSYFLRFSFSLAFLTCLLLFRLLSFPILRFPPWGALRFPSLVRGLSLPGISSLVLMSLHAWSLRISFLLSWFRPFPLSSSSSLLCILTIFLVSALGLSFASSLLVPLSSFLSFSLSLRLVFFLRFLIRLLGVSLFSSRFCHSVVLPLRLTRFHSLSPFAFCSFHG